MTEETFKPIDGKSSYENSYTKTSDRPAASEDMEPLESEPLETEAEWKLRHAGHRLNDFQRLGLQVLAFLFIMYILFTFVVGLITMPTGDMYPRVDSGDLLLIYRLDKDPKAQDIIAFVKNDTRYVARVVAVEGDTVEITDEGALKINGNTMIESNIFYETYRLEGYTQYPLTLKQGECFVLADGRRGTEDSRYYGPVNYKNIMGTVITVVRRNNL